MDCGSGYYLCGSGWYLVRNYELVAAEMISKDRLIDRGVKRLKEKWLDPTTCPVCGKRTRVNGTPPHKVGERYRVCSDYPEKCPYRCRTKEYVTWSTTQPK